jgi:cysteine-rich repeat protein
MANARAFTWAFLLATALSGVARAQTATTAGTLTSPFPTLENLSIVWEITGDDDVDGVVTVRYRESPSGAWRIGLPLVRVPAGANADTNFGTGGGKWTNKHSGSIFDLKPNTTYDIELTLVDPDGGGATKTLTVATRPDPVAASDAVTKNVTPGTFAANIAAAGAGDILLLGAGTYPAFTLTKSGSPGKPLVIRGTSAASVVFDGTVRIGDLKWVYLENVTVKGTIRMDGSENMVIRGCTIRSSGNGIQVQKGTGIPKNNYIADNDLIGPCVFDNASLSVSGCDLGEGIQITGPGNVVCYNHVKGYRDNLSHMEYDEAYDQQSNDFCNNDIESATDDAIEADSAMGNVRVMRNRITNAFDGLSSQPGLGGPTYFVRNVMYNVLYTPFKLHNGTVGDVVFHNTIVKNGDAFGCYSGEPVRRLVLRNNLIIGGTGGGTYGCCSNGTGKVLQIADADNTCSLDYDGFGATGISGFTGQVGAVKFTSLADMMAKTSEKHAVQVDLGVFAATITHPENAFPSPLYPPPDLFLKAGGVAVDKGVALGNVNDGFGGAAPDLGAYELGGGVPHYGPRSGAPVCGNHTLETGEQCDDGNTAGGDGCSPTCTLEGPPGTDAGPSADASPGGDASIPGVDGSAPGSDASENGNGADASESSGCNCQSVTAANPIGRGGEWLMGILFLLVRRARRR